MYPLDKKTSEGRLFWSLPKRAPKKVDFDPTNELHATFIQSFACLFAQKHGIKIISDTTLKFLDEAKNPRSKESRLKMATHAATYKVKDFVPND